MKKLLALSLLTGALAIGTTARALPLAADSPTEIFGSLIFADGWADNPDSPYGIYSFSDEDGSPFSLVKKGREYIANGGACYAGGKYFSIGYETGYYGEIGNIYYRVFDTKDDWKKIREVRLYGTNSIATDLTYNPKNDKIYGCFWINSASKEFSLATVDILTGKPTVIGTLSEQLVGLACRRDGVMFGIGISGNVFRLDITETGVTLVEVGHSNLNVRYAQSAAFDHATDRLLWSATMDDFVAGSALYEVNQTDGSVTYLNAYPDGYEMTGIYTAHEASYQDAPASVSGAYFNFTNDALSGSVNFTMPSTTYGGTATLSGALTYEVVIDDNTELFRTGSATAGTNASVSYSFTTPGWHAYRISAVKDGKRSPVTIGYRWIGVDKAKAVNPVMTKTGTGLSVSWSAPEKGVNGGYIPVNKLTYRVVRQPEGVQVYEGAATSFSENITITALDKYWYDVIALADGKVGETASSNKLRLGQAVTIPYSQDFYKEDAADFYTFIDANNDEITAFHYEDYLMYQYSEENAADDWIITPPLDLNASSVYEVKANVKANSQYFPECFSLHFGTEATAEAMTTELLPATRVDWSDYQEIKAQIRPKENLPGYVGFHIVSDAGADIFTVDDISVVRLASALAPDSVTNLRAVAAKDGSLKATLTFTLPSKALNGTSPANLTSVEIQREGMVIATLNDRHDGETVTYEDLTPSSGINRYTVIVKNTAEGYVKASTSTFVGTDVPSSVPNLKLTDNGEGNLSLAWDAPVSGLNGGFIDPASLTYDIHYRGTTVCGTNQSATSLNYKVDYPVDKQSLAWFSVTPKSSNGAGVETPSDTIAIGDPYPLPFKESFYHMAMEKETWNAITDGIARWTFTNSALFPQDDDGGCAQFSPMLSNTRGDFISPKIDLTGASNPVLSFWIWHNHETDNLVQVVLRSQNGTEQLLETFNSHDRLNEGVEDAWVEHIIPLKDFTLETNQQLIYRCMNKSFNMVHVNYLILDNIQIRDIHATDLRTLSIEGGSDVTVGEPIDFTVKIENYGNEDVENYVINLYRDDRLVSSVPGISVRPGFKKSFTLTDVPNADASETSRYYAEVVAEGDADASNNKTETLVVTVHPGLPFVDDLTGETVADETTLSWTTPPTVEDVAVTATGGAITEDFESYAAFSITNVGEWKLYDGDGAPTAGILDNDYNYVDYPNVEKPMAFMVFNPSEAELNLGYFGTHSGNQAMASFLSTQRVAPDDDWLISPELDGAAQTVTFWTKAPDCAWYGTWEDLEILYSTTDSEPSSFTKISTLKINSENWQQKSFSLPDGAKYFAFRKVSQYQYILYIDDVTYRPASKSLSLIGYNVYRGETLLTAEPIKALTYTDRAAGQQTYTVTAVYDKGESAHSNVYDTKIAAGIEDLLSGKSFGLRVESLEGGLRLTLPEDQDARIYSADGRLIRHVEKSSDIMLPRGVYLVKSEGRSCKALAR